jgi:hypothetical protein
MIYFALFLILASGFSEGAMDTLQFHFDRSVFSKMNILFWNPTISWKNKYKEGDPNKGEKFLFSTTFLVSLTDGWHCMKLIRNITLFISLSFIGFLSLNLIELIILTSTSRIIYGIGFWISYNYILKK